MNLPNTHFTDFPIEFKEINPEDFPHFEVGEKIIISPNEEGYITGNLIPRINLDEKNTVLINAGVGQGKTHSVIEIVKHYYERSEYLIFIASPFVSLVEQYYNDIIDKGIPETSVFRYEILGNETTGDYTSHRVHIVTANCLLGNPGEDAFINSWVKRQYLNTLADTCRRNNRKVVFIYDEIHDTIHNFKEKYIFNLWKWKETIHKNFIVSATYNEASKVVIEYLAELTTNKIQIIESQRSRFRERQSDLILHYNPAYFYKNNNEDIANVFRELVSRNMEIDVLCYSKTLAESIVFDKYEGISKELHKKYTEINNCTSELINGHRPDRAIPQNRYNNNKCNVGTNFKTGISIHKENHALVIIMPPRSSKMPFQNLSGIFSTGNNSIIQAIARKRKKGEIHIILPRPTEFSYETLPFEGEKKLAFINLYDAIKFHKAPEKNVRYMPLTNQRQELQSFYQNTLRANVEVEISKVNNLNREDKVRLLFPEYKLFLLEDGEDYLASEIPFFGGDLSAYITYSAITNQFINCNLKGITHKNILFFEEGNIQRGLDKYYNSHFLDNHYSLYSLVNDRMFYEEFRKDIFAFYEVRLKIGDKWHPVKLGGQSKASRAFELQLIGFVQRMLKPQNPFVISNFYNRNSLVDGVYSRSQYLLESISNSKNVDLSNTNLVDAVKQKIKSFQTLEKLRRKTIRNIKSEIIGANLLQYLPNKPFTNFVGEDLFEVREMLQYLLEEDFFLNLGVYEFARRFKDKTETKKLEVLYSIILEDFFDSEPSRLPTGNRAYIKKIITKKRLPRLIEISNFVDFPDYKFPENFPDSNLEI